MLINFPYINRESPVHRLDPRVKFILLLVLSLVVMQTSNFWVILGCFLMMAYYYSQASLKWIETRRPWFFVILITIILVGVNYFISGGSIVQGVDLSNQHILFTVPFISFKAQFPFIASSPLAFSVEGITYLITQVLRNFSIAFVAISIPYTVDPGVMGLAFRKMGMPDKIAYAIDLSIRFLPTTARDFTTTLDAQRARGFEVDKLRGGLFSKVAKLAPLLVPVIIGSIVGAEDIINAMELRCFGVGKRSWLRELHAREVDRLLIILSFVVLAIITLFNILGYIYLDGPLHFLHAQGIPGFFIP